MLEVEAVVATQPAQEAALVQPVVAMVDMVAPKQLTERLIQAVAVVVAGVSLEVSLGKEKVGVLVLLF